MNEIWKAFKLDEKLCDSYDVSYIMQNSEGTSIRLIGDLNEIIVRFCFVDSFRVTDEGRRLETYNSVDIIQEYREDFYGNPIFLINNSKYVDWIKKESLGFCAEISHYVIITRDDVIDIISSEQPKIEIL